MLRNAAARRRRFGAIVGVFGLAGSAAACQLISGVDNFDFASDDGGGSPEQDGEASRDGAPPPTTDATISTDASRDSAAPDGEVADSGADGSADRTDGGVYPPCSLLFDPKTPPATAAYGLHVIVPGYAGPLVRLQRVGDGGASNVDGGVEDVYPSDGGGFPTDAVTTWAQGASVYVSTWYDQTDGGAATVSQAIQAQQPELVLDALNGNPGVRFTFDDETYLAGTFPWVSGAGKWSAHTTILGGVMDEGAYQPILDYGDVGSQDPTSRSFFLLLQLGGEYTFSASYYGTNIASGVETSAPSTFTAWFDGSTVGGDVNGFMFSGAVAAPNVTATTFWIGGSPDQFGIWLNATLADVVLFPSVIPSSEVNALQANDRACYGFDGDGGDGGDGG